MKLSREKTAKYFRIKWLGWYWVASPIDDGEELKLWLKDGSLVEDELIIEVGQRFKVVKKGECLILEPESEKVTFN